MASAFRRVKAAGVPASGRARWTGTVCERYLAPMGKHSIAEAEGRLAELIDRALEGEEVVITRDGAAVAEIRPVEQPETKQPAPGPMTEETLDWLRERRAGRKMSRIDAGTLLSQMRDEEEH